MSFGQSQVTKILCLLACIVFLLSILSTSVLAQSLNQDDQNSIYNDTEWYKLGVNISSGSGSCSASLSGSDNEAKIWNYLTGQAGLNSVATAGLMGNFQTETGGTWNPRINNGGALSDWPDSSSVAYGLAQWLGSRQDNLVAMAKKQNVIAGDLGIQLNFINSELNGSYKATVRDPIQSLKKGDVKAQVTQAAFIVYQSYEGPNDGSYPAREANAWDVYQKYSSNAPVSGSGDSSCSAACLKGSQPTTPNNAVILCEAEKYGGIYYLSGGGHQGYSAFRQGCPEDSIPTAVKNSTAANPGPCATDCSGLVSVAVDAVYNQSYDWLVDPTSGEMTGTGAQNWQKIPISQALPGDIVTRPDHVEIVVSVKGNNLVTFGSHSTGTKTSQVNSTADYWTVGAWRWAGPGGAK